MPNDRKGRPCWFCINVEGAYMWYRGTFHKFGQDHSDYGEYGPAPYPCAVVEDNATGRVHVVHAEYVSFADNPPTN